MTAPKRIQRKRAKGWRMPEGAIYVGRPSRWGNPFVVHRVDCSSLGGGMCWSIYAKGWSNGGLVVDHIDHPFEAHQEAVRLFELHIGPFGSFEYDSDRLAELDKLAGHDLACWCPLAYPCHADVLLRMANPS